MQQLVKLEQKSFQDPALQYVKDIFLFSCYTGLAFADVMQLRKSHFEMEVNGITWCKLYRQKSNVLSSVPLLKSAIEIIEKYNHCNNTSETDKIFPHVTNQNVNRHLKLIQEICETISRFLFMLPDTLCKTIALKNGIPLETIQMLIGHTKITTTQIYADVDEEKIINDMEGLDYKLEQNRATVLKKFLMWHPIK